MDQCEPYASYIEKKFIKDRKIYYLFTSLYMFLENDYFPMSKSITNLYLPAKLFYEKSIANEVYTIINHLNNISQRKHSKNQDIINTIKKIETKKVNIYIKNFLILLIAYTIKKNININ